MGRARCHRGSSRSIHRARSKIEKSDQLLAEFMFVGAAQMSMPCSWKKEVRSLSLACKTGQGGERRRVRRQGCGAAAEASPSLSPQHHNLVSPSVNPPHPPPRAHQLPKQSGARHDADAHALLVHHWHPVDLVLCRRGGRAGRGPGEWASRRWPAQLPRPEHYEPRQPGSLCPPLQQADPTPERPSVVPRAHAPLPLRLLRAALPALLTSIIVCAASVTLSCGPNAIGFAVMTSCGGKRTRGAHKPSLKAGQQAEPPAQWALQ